MARFFHQRTLATREKAKLDQNRNLEKVSSRRQKSPRIYQEIYLSNKGFNWSVDILFLKKIREFYLRPSKYVKKLEYLGKDQQGNQSYGQSTFFISTQKHGKSDSNSYTMCGLNRMRRMCAYVIHESMNICAENSACAWQKPGFRVLALQKQGDKGRNDGWKKTQRPHGMSSIFPSFLSPNALPPLTASESRFSLD